MGLGVMSRTGSIDKINNCIRALQQGLKFRYKNLLGLFIGFAWYWLYFLVNKIQAVQKRPHAAI
jgi:hypothetical protein